MNRFLQKPKGLRHFVASFVFSLSGLKMAFSETAIRQELFLGVFHAIAVLLVCLPFVVKFVLSLLWVAIIIIELLNTAIEAVVDLASPEYHELAKKSKDLGSAAVFCSLITFFSAWIVVLVKFLK